MNKPSLSIRLAAKMLHLDPDALAGEHGRAEFLRWIAQALDIELTRRCEICGYDLDIWTWRNHMAGIVSCSVLRADNEKLLREIESARQETVRANAQTQRQVVESNGLGRILDEIGAKLVAAGYSAQLDSLADSVERAIQSPIERDFAWALEQVHAGKTVTHPCIGDENRIGTLKQVGTLEADHSKQPVYELNQGGGVYKNLLWDDVVMRLWVARARKSHGWKIFIGPDEPK